MMLCAKSVNGDYQSYIFGGPQSAENRGLISQRTWRIANPISVPDIFHRTGFPQLYELILKLPIIRNIRAQEQQLIRRILDENVRAEDEVLEIGAGTGFYSFEIAKRCREMIALERAPGMARILARRIACANVSNIRVRECDFLTYWRETGFDVVAAIGVLDCIADWRPFLERCMSLARRQVIVTVPQESFWGYVYQVFGKMSRSRVWLAGPEELRHFLQDGSVKIWETGLRTRWTRGLTLVMVIEVETANCPQLIR